MKLLGGTKSKITKDKNSENVLHLEITNSEFSYIEVWFTDQNCKPLEIEDKINITLVINWSVKYKKWCAIQFSLEIKYFYKAMDLFLLLKIWVKML